MGGEGGNVVSVRIVRQLTSPFGGSRRAARQCWSFGAPLIFAFAHTFATACLFATISQADTVALPLLRSFELDQANAHLGYSAAAAGDLNGDSFADLVFGVRDYDAGQTNEGRVVVYFGGANGFAALPDWAFESDQALAFLGQAVSSAGDVNGDGFHDLIVSAPSYDEGQSNEGIVWLFLGSSAGLAATPHWSHAGEQATAVFGTSVAFAGDVNADGFDDVLIGVRGADGSFQNEGRAELYLGNAGGLAATPVWSVTGGQDDPGFGQAVAGVGDVNADGYDDIAVGAFFYDAGEIDEGAAFVYFGGPAGPALAPSWTGQSNQADAHFGWSVAGAGDVNGDGYADLLVGARDYSGSLSNEGRSYLYLGSPSGLQLAPSWTASGGELNASFGWSVGTAGDLNGDGLADVIVGAPKRDGPAADAGAAHVYFGSKTTSVEPSPSWTRTGAAAGAQFGYAVGAAGDVGGDGFGDVLVGAAFEESGQVDEGLVFLYGGLARLPELAPSYRVSGGTTSLAYGTSMAFLGDVNGDGFADLAVGDPFHSGGQTSEGRVDVYYGRAGGFDTVPDWTVESNQASSFFGWAVARAGDVNGDGFDDLLAGAPQWDGSLTNEGKVTLYLGTVDGLASTPMWTRTGGQSGANFGHALSGGGDANGDGFSDFAVGAPLQDSIVADAGALHWFRGAASGPTLLPQRMIVGTTVGEEVGFSLDVAGDVNGDGLHDVLVGAPGFSGGELQEGAARLILGEPGGLAATYSWNAEGNQEEARFGERVSFAGDVDGDGMTDVLASARGFDGMHVDEGEVRLYRGGANGVATVEVWSHRGGAPGAELHPVAAVGDINGDGFGDVVVGVPFDSPSQAGHGSVRLFLGTAAGLAATPGWTYLSPVPSAQCGSSLAGPGDGNGDGFGDVAFGAKGLFDGLGQGGAALLAWGNGGPGAHRLFVQRAGLGDVPLALYGTSLDGASLTLRGTGSCAAGRTQLRLQIESTGLPVGWSDAVRHTTANLETSPPMSGLGSTATWEATSGNFFAGARLRWRARLLSDSPYFPSTPWFSPPGNSPTEWDLRTNPQGPTTIPALIVETDRSGGTGSAPRIVRCGPMPLRDRAWLEFEVDRPGPVEVNVYDVQGRFIRRVAEGWRDRGNHVVPLDREILRGSRGIPGVYFLQVRGPGGSASRRIVVAPRVGR